MLRPGPAVDALTDKTEPVIERPDPNVILVAAGDELFDPNNSELALNGANCPVPTTFAPSCVAPTDPAIICADPIELDAINPVPNVILEAAGDELLEPISSDGPDSGANCPFPTTLAPNCVAPTHLENLT